VSDHDVRELACIIRDGALMVLAIGAMLYVFPFVCDLP
jgi:hypothetical protein